MKKVGFLLATMLIFSLFGCSDDDKTRDEVVVEDGKYTGTLKVDQKDGTFYTQENVSVEVTVGENDVEIKLFQVSFSERMPVALDMTISGITFTQVEEGLSITGDNIIPQALGGAFPAYLITGMTGGITPETLTFDLICGEYPLTFTGRAESN